MGALTRSWLACAIASALTPLSAAVDPWIAYGGAAFVPAESVNDTVIASAVAAVVGCPVTVVSPGESWAMVSSGKLDPRTSPPQGGVPLRRSIVSDDGVESVVEVVPRLGFWHRGAVVEVACPPTVQPGEAPTAPAATRYIVTVTEAVGGRSAIVSSLTQVPAQGPPPAAALPRAVEIAVDGTQAAPVDEISKSSAASLTCRPRSGRVATIRAMTYNVWNTNPPSWLWRGPGERLRQYALRLYHLGDVMRRPGADVIALQEVRLDTTLPPPLQASPAAAATALHTATDWYNRTRTISALPAYHKRAARFWEDVTKAPGFEEWVRGHPYESPWRNVTLSPPAGAEAVGGDAADANGDTGTVPAPDMRSPFEVNMPRGLPAEWSYERYAAEVAAAAHGQVRHLSLHLPGHQFAAQAGQVYLDEDGWLSGNQQRDEEGPAVFSPSSIVSWQYALLSRDPADDGDGHQRIALHAVVDVSHTVKGAGGGCEAGDDSTAEGRGGCGDGAAAADAGGTEPVLIDVYTVHLALSERARNRTVPELLAFVAATARGRLQLLMGDMNAEPHEPAMQALVDPRRCLQVEGPLKPEAQTPPGPEDAATPAPTPTPAPCVPAADLAAAARVDIRDGPSGRPTPATAVPSGLSYPAGALPGFVDTWVALHPEPQPGDSNPATRRYGFTFPADNPVKRIDLAFAAVPLGGCAAGGGLGLGFNVTGAFVVGQDALPGTDAYEGKGVGMVSTYSPLYASDHRAVVVDLALGV